jgi:hypothetical protein
MEYPKIRIAGRWKVVEGVCGLEGRTDSQRVSFEEWVRGKVIGMQRLGTAWEGQ